LSRIQIYPLLWTDVGVGVHRTRSRSFSFPLLDSQPAVRSIASALLAAAVPMVVRSSRRRAAGVRFPLASARRGVHEGGGMLPFFPSKAVLILRGVPLDGFINSAFARKLFDAFSESL